MVSAIGPEINEFNTGIEKPLLDGFGCCGGGCGGNRTRGDRIYINCLRVPAVLKLSFGQDLSPAPGQ